MKVREYNGKDTDWKDNIKIKKNQQIEFRIVYRNIKSYKQERVLISDILPENVKYVHGIAKMHNNAHPDEIKINSDELFSDQGFDMGDYEPKAISTINFCVEVILDAACAEDLTITFPGCTAGMPEKWISVWTKKERRG